MRFFLHKKTYFERRLGKPIPPKLHSHFPVNGKKKRISSSENAIFT